MVRDNMKILILDEDNRIIEMIKDELVDHFVFHDLPVIDNIKDEEGRADVILIASQYIKDMPELTFYNSRCHYFISYGINESSLDIRKQYSMGINDYFDLKNISQVNKCLESLENFKETDKGLLTKRTSNILHLSSNLDSKIELVLKEINSSFSSSRCSIIYIRNNTVRQLCEYDLHEGVSRKHVYEKLSEHTINFFEEISKHKCYYINDENNTNKKSSKHLLKEFKNKKTIIVPFYVKQEMFMLVLLNPTKYNFCDDDVLYECGRIIEKSLNGREYIKSLTIDDDSGLLYYSAFLYEYDLLNKDGVSPILIKLEILDFERFTSVYNEKAVANIFKNLGHQINDVFSGHKFIACHRPKDTEFYIFVEETPDEINDMLMKIINTALGYHVEMIAKIYPLSKTNESILEIDTKLKNINVVPANKIYYYDVNQISKNESTRILEEFNYALKKGQIKAYFQPKYNTRINKFYGAEALARWIKDDGTVISPMKFVPVLEATGFIFSLDRQILIETLAALREWLDAGLSVGPISVNLSQYDFLRAELYEELIELIDTYSIPHNLIQFEITETAFVSYDDYISSFVKKCNETGILVLLDDFGSGYSSLNSLKDMDVDIIKLDCKFLSKTGNVEKKRRIIASIASMIRLLNITIVAEGVETAEDSNLLYQMGIYNIQGFLYSKPVSKHDFSKMLGDTILIDEDIKNDTIDLDRLFDPNANENKFLSLSFIPSFILRYDRRDCVIILKNKEGDTLLEKINSLGNGVLLQQIDEEFLSSFQGYLEQIIEGRVKGVSKHVEELRLTEAYKFTGKFNIQLISDYEHDSYFLLEVVEEDGGKRGFSLDNFKTLYDSVDLMAFVVKDNQILYYNDEMENNFGYCKYAKSYDDFANYYNVKRTLNDSDSTKYCFIPALSSNCQIYKRKIQYENSYATLYTINSRAKLVNNEYMDYRDRISHITSNVIDFYTEINLDLETYQTYNFSNNTTLNIPNAGKIDSLNAYNVERIDREYLAPNKSPLNIKSSLDIDKMKVVRIKIQNNYFDNYINPFTVDQSKVVGILSLNVTKEESRKFDNYTGFYNADYFRKLCNQKLLEDLNDNYDFTFIEITNFDRIIVDYSYNKFLDYMTELSKLLKKHLDPTQINITRYSISSFILFYKNVEMSDDMERVISILESTSTNILKKLKIGVFSEVISTTIHSSEDGKSFSELFNKAYKRNYKKKTN